MRDDRRCIVVGAGLLGLSAAWALSRRQWRVTVVEAADAVGHDRSGSKGDARIFRLGYPEPVYVDMALRARALWHDLQAASGRRLLHGRGQVSFGDDASLDAIAAALAAAGSPAERLEPGEAARRFPAIAVHGSVLFEPDSCVLAADQCLWALGEVADFVVHTGERVGSLHQRRDSVTVTTASGRTLDADVVVDCAGPDALALLDDPPPVAAPPSFPQVAYFGPAPGATPEERPPIFIEWGPDMIYGLPVPGGGARGGTYKVSHQTPGTDLDGDDPAGTAPLDDDPGLLALLTGAVRSLLPSLDPDPVHTERCVYDNSADTDFILARTGRIVVGCGTSGHGFKFGPLLGELLADLADGATPAIDLRPFGLHRDPAPPHRPAHHSR